MPPKKILQPLPGQNKLSFGGRPLHIAPNDDEPDSVPKSDSVSSSALSLSNVALTSDNRY